MKRSKNTFKLFRDHELLPRSVSASAAAEESDADCPAEVPLRF